MTNQRCSFVVDNNDIRDRGRNVHRGWSQSTWWFQVGEIMIRDLQGMQRYLQEREDSRKLQQEGCTGGRVCDQQCWRLIWVVWDGGYLKGRQTHIKSNIDLRRWNQRSSISQGLKVFQRSQGMQVIFAKDDQQILQLHRLVVVWQQYDETKVICFGSVQVRLVGAWEEWFLAGRRKSEESPS